MKVLNNHVIDLSLNATNVIDLSLNATKTNNHFGDTPIYGIIPSKEDIMKMNSHMGNKMNMNMHTNTRQW